MEHEKLTGRIIKAAIAVHRSLGPGFLESIYESALCVELEEEGLSFERQLVIPVKYKGKEVGEHRVDVLVEKKIILELKAVSTFEDIFFSIVRSYLKACGLRHGLLLNFASMPLTVKRVIFDPSSYEKTNDSCVPDFLMKESAFG